MVIPSSAAGRLGAAPTLCLIVAVAVIMVMMVMVMAVAGDFLAAVIMLQGEDLLALAAA